MKNLSISIKIALGFALILIMLVVINIISANNILHLTNDAKSVEHTQEVINEIEHTMGGLKDAEVGQRGFIITGTENYLEPYNAAKSNLEEQINGLSDLTSDNSVQQQRIAKLRQLVDQKFEELEETIKIRRDIGFEASKEIVMTDLGKAIMDDIRVVLNEMTEIENKLLVQRKIHADEDSAFSKRIIFWLISLTCLFVFALILYFTRIISTPIKKLSTIAEDIALGDLSSEIGKKNKKDEIGILSNSFSLMQQNLREKARQVEIISSGDLTVQVKPQSDKDTLGIAFESMVENLRVQMNEINEGVNVLSSSSSEIMSTISQLAASSAETTTSLSETSATIEEIRQTSEVSHQKAVEVADSGKKIALISQDGSKSVQKTIDGMKKIKQQMESIAGIVIQLSEKSQTIGEIASTVSDLAEQSNLLAVNASIEAAKAGEQGKGFTVVAQEIKNLANRSKDSTVQIRTILADIQKEISGAVMATEQGGKVIDEGLNLSNTANEVIVALAASVEQASQANLIIATSSQQQLVGMDQIASAMENIKDASNQNAASTKQTEESVSELKNLGELLINLLNHYKLE